MKFGIMLPHFRHVASPDAIARMAQEAEVMKFDSLWITDRTVVYPGSDETRFGANFYDPFLTLTYAAVFTHKIKLGTSVIVVPYRSPVALARTTATLDVMSNGRLILGIGVSGGKDDTRKEFGILQVPLAQRGAKTDEALRVIRELWTSDKPSFNGKFWQFDGFPFEPKPVQKPHPPIWIGGNRDIALKRTLEQGAEGWHPSTMAVDKIAEAVKFLKSEAPKFGRKFEDLAIAPRESLKIMDSRYESKSPLIGTIDQIKKGIEKYKAIGANHMVLDLFFGYDELHSETPDSMLKTMDLLARKVTPLFR